MKGGMLPLREDFSIVLGGPLYQIWRRTRLVRPPLELLIRRIVVITLLAWLPLFALSFLSGNALRGVAVPFLFDLDTHVRFLIVLPLLIGTELYTHARISLIARLFQDRGIVTPEIKERFLGIVDSTLRLRNSVVAETLLVVIVYVVGHWIWTHQAALTVATWYASRDTSDLHLTLAGYWYAFVGIPIFQFLLLRWYYRMALWYRFLWKVSRLNLRLIATHPDGAGGLGFLALNAYAFAPILVAHTVLLAGMIANRIWHQSASLPDFRLEIAGMLVYLLALAFLPLTAFTPTLLKAKLAGLAEFGGLSQSYVSAFDAKWVRGGAPVTERLVGSSDIQSLADLANSYKIVQGMRPIPFGKETVFRVAMLLVLPFLPLIPTVIPVDKMFGAMVDLLL